MSENAKSAKVADLFPISSAPTNTESAIAVAESAFTTFWSVTLRKVDAAKSKHKFVGICTTEFVSKSLDKSSGEYVALVLHSDPETIIQGWKAYQQRCMEQGDNDWKKWVMHPKTWLGGGGWMDWEYDTEERDRLAAAWDRTLETARGK